MKKSYKVMNFLTLLLFTALLFNGCLNDIHTSVDDEAKETLEVNANTQEIAESLKEGQELTIHFLNVGQGNAVLVQQDGKNMLIDGGDREYSSFVVSYLKKIGIKKLDYVVVSHYDADHLNGIVGALNVFPCDVVLGPDYEAKTKVYESFQKVMSEEDLKFQVPRLGETFGFADSEFTIVSPVSYEYKDVNEMSVGIKLKYGEKSFLICGDIGNDTEQDMLLEKLDIESDVFLANHHGSNYSNSSEFLDAVSPKYVVISAGMNNKYGHPSAALMLEVQKQNASLYRTDLQGTILLTSNGKDIIFQTEPSMDYRSGAEIKSESHEAPSINDTQTIDETLNDADIDEIVSYVINLNTKKFHLPDCSSVRDMSEQNKSQPDKTKEELMNEGYEPCQRCKP